MSTAAVCSLGVISFAGIVCLSMWGCPRYEVYSQNMQGEAELARASQNRQIKIREAEAAAEAARLLAEAEIERAKGVAEANRIIGESLKGNEAYLRYLWIQGLQEGSIPAGSWGCRQSGTTARLWQRHCRAAGGSLHKSL